MNTVLDRLFLLSAFIFIMMSVKNYAFRFRGNGSHLGFYGLAKVHVNNGHENDRGLPKQVLPKNCVIMTNGEKCN